MKRAIFSIAVIYLMICQTAIAGEAIPSVVSCQPHSDEQNFCSTILEMRLSCHSKQTFALKLSPAANLKSKKTDDPKRLGDIWSWQFQSYRSIRPKTRYTAHLTSSQPFLYRGRKVRDAVWMFTTAPADWLSELGSGDGNPYEAACPFIELVTDKLHFSVSVSEQRKYDVVVKLHAAFNAGVNGPPISEQLKRYYREIGSYKEEARAWIRSKGYNPKKMAIRWDYTRF